MQSARLASSLSIFKFDISLAKIRGRLFLDHFLCFIVDMIIVTLVRRSKTPKKLLAVMAPSGSMDIHIYTIMAHFLFKNTGKLPPNPEERFLVPAEKSSLSGRDYVALNLGGGHGPRWAVNFWILLGKIFAENGLHPVFVVGLGENGLLRHFDLLYTNYRIEFEYEIKADLNFSALMALFAGARGVVSIDSGPAHLAVAVNSKLVLVAPHNHVIIKQESTFFPYPANFQASAIDIVALPASQFAGPRNHRASTLYPQKVLERAQKLGIVPSKKRS